MNYEGLETPTKHKKIDSINLQHNFVYNFYYNLLKWQVINGNQLISHDLIIDITFISHQLLHSTSISYGKDCGQSSIPRHIWIIGTVKEN